MDRFPAVVAAGPGPAGLVELGEEDLPAGSVTIEVSHSSLNYKDGLAVTGTGKVIRSFPLTCGIDLAGTVRSSIDPAWRPGDAVLATGCGLGETHPGGYTTLQRVPGEWLVRIPDRLDARRAMALGTAGFTAMLAARAIEGGASGDDGHSAGGDGEVLVTGAGGGVGSVAVAVLSRLGYRVVASTGRPELHGYLTGLGAAEIIGRAGLGTSPVRPLQPERWRGVVDTVGGTILANALAQSRRDGVVAACGLAGSSDLATTVFPFILRGVRLAGVDSVWRPAGERLTTWTQLAEVLPGEVIDGFSTVEPMSAIAGLAGRVLGGEIRGRVVIDTAR